MKQMISTQPKRDVKFRVSATAGLHKTVHIAATSIASLSTFPLSDL